MHIALKILFAASGVLPFIIVYVQQDTSLLIYTVFVALYFITSNRGPTRFSLWKIFLATLLAGFAAEIFNWTSNYVANSAHPALLSPQLFSDLFLAIGYYLGWIMAWMMIAARFRFNLVQVFGIAGLTGIFVEQQGTLLWKIITGALSNPSMSYLMAFFVFVIYGSIMGISRLFWTSPPGALEHSWLKYLVVAILMFVLSAALTEVFTIIGNAAGIVQAPLPIRSHPLFP